MENDLELFDKGAWEGSFVGATKRPHQASKYCVLDEVFRRGFNVFSHKAY